jgi:hypothetical protein
MSLDLLIVAPTSKLRALYNQEIRAKKINNNKPKGTIMKYNRFPPEGYWQKALFYSFCFFIWPIFGMQSTEHILVTPSYGSKVEVIDIEYDLDIEEECTCCGRAAVKTVFLVDWQVVHLCSRHFNRSVYKDLGN